MAKIGIGIVTYNRVDYLKRAVAAVRVYSTSPYELVVADDGSTDGTIEWCRSENIRIVTGPNRGVCWNKNRALFALQELGCDPILLLEDDCAPIRQDWEWDWRIGTALFGHLAFAHPKLDRWKLGGSGSPIDPILNNKATAQCSSVSGIALAQVGFLDTRFKGYGVGHAEWTTRLKRAGYGFRVARDENGQEVKANLYIQGGLRADDAPTFKDKENIARNERLFDEIKKEPIYRNPWSDPEERKQFLAEMREASISGRRHELLATEMEGEIPELRLRHLRPYGKAFRRAFAEARSFLNTSGWLSSMALGIPTYENEIVPWFNYSITYFLKQRVKPHWNVFEYGAGYSTLWWSTKVESIVSVESDPGWAELVGKLCSGRPATILTNPPDETFSLAINKTDRLYDVIVVDGFDRPGCLRQCVDRLTDDGVIILDNSNRQEYRSSVAELEQRGFRELAIKGVTPMTYKEETTSIIYRNINTMGI